MHEAVRLDDLGPDGIDLSLGVDLGGGLGLGLQKRTYVLCSISRP